MPWRHGALLPPESVAGQPVYSSLAIEAALALQLVFHQPVRQIESMLPSIAQALESACARSWWWRWHGDF
jgi:hypothetical protein